MLPAVVLGRAAVEHRGSGGRGPVWPLLLLAAAATVVQGAQYGDYGAVKMPAYGDYEAPHDAPRDAPLEYLPAVATSQDYKDELDKVTQKRLSSREYGNGNWQKPSRKQYKRARHDEDYSDVNRRSRDDRRHRDDLERAVKDESPREGRARGKHKRDQHDDDDDFSIEKYIQGINENNLAVDARGRKSTEVVVRRKPRDRDLGKTEASFKEDEFDEELRLAANQPRVRVPGPLKEKDGPNIVDVSADSEDFMPRSEGGRDLDALPIEEMRRQTQEPAMARRGGGGGGGGSGYEEPPRLRPAQRARLDPGAASDTSDYEYFDLKRLHNVKNKVPGFKLPSEAREEDWAPSKDEEVETRRLLNAAKRRPASRTTRRTIKTTKTVTTTTATKPATTTVAIVRTSSEPTLTPGEGNSLSLAEKSRLSIMKKAGQKEREKGGASTTKPPVLLQVTKQMPTVVFVEKSTPGDPWLRAHEVREDSPQNLARVRALMRKKLVANAKNIRDLAEDWDQLICDYVDVGLLENRAGPVNPNVALVLMVSSPFIWFVV